MFNWLTAKKLMESLIVDQLCLLLLSSQHFIYGLELTFISSFNTNIWSKFHVNSYIGNRRIEYLFPPLSYFLLHYIKKDYILHRQWLIIRNPWAAKSSSMIIIPRHNGLVTVLNMTCWFLIYIKQCLPPLYNNDGSLWKW